MNSRYGFKAITVFLAFGACAATANAATDKTTGLPLFTGSRQPMSVDNDDYCGSALKGTNYSIDTNSPGIVAWFKGKLPGFRYEHAKMPDGHPGDFFISGDGKQIVELFVGTGERDSKYFVNAFYYELTPAVDPNKLYTEVKNELPCSKS